MNDRFKFRAWDEKVKFYLSDEAVQAMAPIRVWEEKGWIVEQCTGLKDKNGRLIYEGDIVKFKISTVKCVGAVRWDEHTGGWLKDSTGQPLHTYLKTVEVIGNIHENPDLLKEHNK